ncbi:hypothetical protein V2J09_013890 [Rumex salicifolius]
MWRSVWYVYEFCPNHSVRGIVTSRELALSLLQLQFSKVESKAYFMSEQSSLFLTLIGLLGEYCPTSRRKDSRTFHKVDCMQLGPYEGYTDHSQGCKFMQPFPFIIQGTLAVAAS